MNISDMLTKAVTRQTLRRCLAQAESWRLDGERVDEEYVVEINTVETGLVRQDQCPKPVDGIWPIYKIVLLILLTAGVAIYLCVLVDRMLKKMWNKLCPRTRTVGTQSQTTYTALAHHATPRFTLVPDLRPGVFEDGKRIWSKNYTSPRNSNSS